MHRWIARFTHRTARARPVAVAWGWLHATVVRRTGGRIGGRFIGAPVLVLVTIGRRSGRVRQTPLFYATDGDRLVLLAANAGNDRPPAWWLNLRAAETVEVLIRGRRQRRRWHEAQGEEYDRLFAVIVATYPPAAHYVAMTERRLPVVVLQGSD
jgi:deazaflavin-dependent oxidoreductase (nitroreductase family)